MPQHTDTPKQSRIIGVQEFKEYMIAEGRGNTAIENIFLADIGRAFDNTSRSTVSRILSKREPRRHPGKETRGDSRDDTSKHSSADRGTPQDHITRPSKKPLEEVDPNIDQPGAAAKRRAAIDEIRESDAKVSATIITGPYSPRPC